MEQSEDLELFLEPAPGIQCQDPRVHDLARSIVRGSRNDIEAARRLFEFVRDTVRYSVNVPMASLDDYLALNTLARGKGFCVQKSALLCALARALGIPARLGFADIKNQKLHGRLGQMIPHGVIYHHCFVEWFVGGRWLKATSSFDRALTEHHGWRLVEFDGAADALLPASDLQGQPHVSYLAYHGWRQGVPLKEFIQVTVDAYGPDSVKEWDARGRQAGKGRMSEVTLPCDMTIQVGSLTLRNPVLAASGTFGYGQEYAPHLDLTALGGLVTKGVSLKPRAGNPPPRICETASGMLNAIGLANVGLEAFIRDKQPFLQGLHEKGLAVVVNLYGESVAEFASLARGLEGKPGLSALEINVSCPNVSGGGMAFGVDPAMVGQATAAVKANTSLPVWVKLTPNVSDPVPMAEAAKQAGAEAVSLINTLLGMAIHPRTQRPRLANVFGGLSGPAIKPVGLRMVHQVARAVDIPVVGLGGIMSGSDAAEYLLAGASAVQVGTASFADPAACARIAQELALFCQEQGKASVRELVGGLRL